MGFTQRHDPVKTLALDRQNESFRKSIEVRTMCGQSHCLDASLVQDSPECLRVQWIPCCPEVRRRGSSCLTVIEVEKPAEARSAGNLAICPVVIRRTDVPDQLSTVALVKPLC